MVLTSERGEEAVHHRHLRTAGFVENRDLPRRQAKLGHRDIVNDVRDPLEYTSAQVRLSQITAFLILPFAFGLSAS